MELGRREPPEHLDGFNSVARPALTMSTDASPSWEPPQLLVLPSAGPVISVHAAGANLVCHLWHLSLGADRLGLLLLADVGDRLSLLRQENPIVAIFRPSVSINVSGVTP